MFISACCRISKWLEFYFEFAVVHSLSRNISDVSFPACFKKKYFYSELSLDSFIHACLWDVSESLEPQFVAHSSISLFSKRGMLRTGTIGLKMEMAASPDGYLVPPVPSKV